MKTPSAICHLPFALALALLAACSSPGGRNAIVTPEPEYSVFDPRTFRQTPPAAEQLELPGAQQTIGVGTTANDGTGDTIRAAFQKVNANFTELYTADGTKLATTNGTAVGLTLSGSTTNSAATASRAAIYDSAKVLTSSSGVDTTELEYLDGVTSALQTQLNAKQATITGAATTIDTEDLTASRALISNASGKVEVSGTVSDTELGRLDGVTGALYYAGGTDVPVADGGTGASTLSGIVYGNGTSAMTAGNGTAGTFAKFSASSPGVANSILSESGSTLTLAGASTLTTSTGNMTLGTGGGDGNILINPNGTGKIGIGNVTSPEVLFHVGGTGTIATMVVGATGASIVSRDDGATSGQRVFDWFNRSGVLTLRLLADNLGSVTRNIATFNQDGTVSISALTQHSILFSGAAGAVSQDNANLTYNASTFTLTAPIVSVSTNLVLAKTITAAATTGNQTINKSSGRVNFAAAAQTLTVTCNLCTANSIVIATVVTDDTTAKSVIATPGSGSFVLKLNAAATAETAVAFILTN